MCLVLPAVALAIMCSCTDTNNNAIANTPAIVLPDASMPRPDAAPEVDAAEPEPTPVKEPGYLWFAGGALSAFTKTAVQASTDRGPGVTVVPITMEPNFHDVVFDRDGNAWVLPIKGNQILRIPAAGLATDALPTPPDVIITGTSLKSPQSLTFDAAGNLWVLNYEGAGFSTATIVRFDNPGQLAGTAQVDPTLTITPSSSERSLYSQGTTIAFDRQGNLWFAGVANVWRLDHATALSGAVIASPSAVISSGNDAYVSIAFDSVGSLWVTGARNGYYVMRIDGPGLLTGTVIPAPAAIAHLPLAGAMFAGGMGFDGDGALWIAMSNRIVKLPNPRGLAGDGTPTPAITLGLKIAPDLASKIAFWPAPPSEAPGN